jgi:hypothetical protein
LGEDRFTYRISDGRLDSNTTTVTLIVTLSKEAGDLERPGKSATITLHSTLTNPPRRSLNATSF